MTAAVDASGGTGGVFGDPRPRPELTAALAGDFSGLVGQEVEAGLVAAFHAENHAAWARCRWLYETCRSRAGTTVRAGSDTKAALIAAAALAWSPAMAAARWEFARQVLVRLPRLGEGMREGWLEERRAAIFVNTLRELDDAAARLVLDRLLGKAARLTHGELARAVEKAAADVDRGWYEARRAAAVARARVVARSAPSGAAELSGLDLDETLALEAYEHVVALADAISAAVRARGGEVGKAFVEAHVYLRLLHPDLLGADDATVVAALTEELLQPPTPDDNGGPDDDGPDDDGPGDGGPDDSDTDDNGPDDNGPDDNGLDGGPEDGGSEDGGSEDGGSEDGGSEDGGPDDLGPDHGDPHDGGPDDPTPDDGGSVNAASGDPGSADADADCGSAEPGAGSARGGAADETPAGSAPLAYRAGIAVRLSLSTLLRLDNRPGEVPDYGIVAGSTARHLARTRCGATTRLLLYDPRGHLEYVLTLPPLGGRGARKRGRHRKQVVELTAYTTTLEGLDVEDHLGLDATLLAGAKAELAAQRARPPGEHPAHSTAEAQRRHPGAELAAWLQSRDQTCRFPGCTRPALQADLDHTWDWLFGGPTQADNLGPLCEPHHLLKHDPDHPWTLEQPTPGVFAWTSPTGTRHTVEPEPYDELPDPREPHQRPANIPDIVFDPPPRTPPPWAARPNRHGHITDAARATATRLTATTHPTDPPSRYDHDPDF